MPTVTLYQAARLPIAGRLEVLESSPVLGCGASGPLGVHLSENPVDALLGSMGWDGRPLQPGIRVLVVEAELSRVLRIWDAMDLRGEDWRGNRICTAADYAARRQTLLAAGYHAVCTEAGTLDGRSGICVVLDPESLRIKGSMTFDQAFESDAVAAYGAVAVDSGSLFEMTPDAGGAAVPQAGPRRQPRPEGQRGSGDWHIAQPGTRRISFASAPQSVWPVPRNYGRQSFGLGSAKSGRAAG
jgi:hypothetical protein